MTVTRRDALKLTLAQAALGASARGAQHAPKADSTATTTLDVVFEGGGIKGAAFCGALKALEEGKFRFRHLVGASAGAITAALLAAGYHADRLREALSARDEENRHFFNTFLLPPSSFPAPPIQFEPSGNVIVDNVAKRAITKFPGMWKVFTDAALNANTILHPFEKYLQPQYKPARIREYMGRSLAVLSVGSAASDENFLKWLTKQITEGPDHLPADVTLEAFHARTAARGVQLTVMATDVTAKRLLVLNHRTAPKVPLVQAVRMSMGLPLVWPEVEWQPGWGPYRRFSMKDEQGNPHRVVDGGILANFPLKYILDPKHRAETGVIGPFLEEKSTGPLGLILDESLSFSDEDTKQKERARFGKNMPAYQSLSRLIDTITGATDQDTIDEFESDKWALCRIPVKGIDLLDFDLEPTRMAALVDSGYKAMGIHLAERQARLRRS
jgi:NTE family protein